MNTVDQDRLNAKTAGNNVVDIKEYRAQAARAMALDASSEYLDPATRRFASLGALFLFVLFVLFVVARR